MAIFALLFAGARGLLFLNSIYLRSDIYDDVYSSDNPHPENVSVLIHEQTHLNRMRSMGMIRFGIKYIFSPEGRFEEELVAIKEQMKHLKKHDLNYDIERTAKALSGWAYLWCTTYDKAYKELLIRWSEV